MVLGLTLRALKGKLCPSLYLGRAPPQVLLGAEGPTALRWAVLIPMKGKVISSHVLRGGISSPSQYKGLHGVLSVNSGSPNGKCVLYRLAQSGV